MTSQSLTAGAAVRHRRPADQHPPCEARAVEQLEDRVIGVIEPRQPVDTGQLVGLPNLVDAIEERELVDALRCGLVIPAPRFANRLSYDSPHRAVGQVRWWRRRLDVDTNLARGAARGRRGTAGSLRGRMMLFGVLSFRAVVVLGLGAPRLGFASVEGGLQVFRISPDKFVHSLEVPALPLVRCARPPVRLADEAGDPRAPGDPRGEAVVVREVERLFRRDPRARR